MIQRKRKKKKKKKRPVRVIWLKSLYLCSKQSGLTLQTSTEVLCGPSAWGGTWLPEMLVRHYWDACLLVLLHYPDVPISSFNLRSSLYLTAVKIPNSTDKLCFHAVLWTSCFGSTCQSFEVFLSGSSHWFCRVSYREVALNNFTARECLSPQGGGNKWKQCCQN